MHQLDALVLTEKFSSAGPINWLKAVAPLHVRAYSFSQILFGRWIGFNILSLEPMNLLYYLAILTMVFRLAEALFDRRAALLATVVVALWPSLLLHTTQPLRDPLLITLVMVFFLIVRRWIVDNYSWRQAITAGLGAALVLLAIWVVRLAMWDIARAVVGLGIVFVILRQMRERRILISNIITGVILIAVLLIIPHCNKLLQFTEKREVESGRVLIGESVVGLSLWDRIAARREAFINLRTEKGYRAGSDIDSDVHFESKSDVIRYLPRAMAIGLFAPFPNMWFAEGELVGRTGRMISGAEMLLTYLIEVLAAVGLWHKRRQLFIWLLASSAIIGVTALGLIVTNIGSLYRLRYSYWILLVILGAEGAVHLGSRPWSRKQLLSAGTSKAGLSES